MELIKPTLKYKRTWEEAIQEFNEEKAVAFWNVRLRYRNTGSLGITGLSSDSSAI